MNKFYVTTAIDYVNDTIHIGHAFQKIIADVLARYYRIKIGKENVFFLTGTDEYGKKSEKAAKDKGVSPAEFVKEISDTDQKEQDSLNISYDRFIRTTDPDHEKVVSEIWNRVNNNDDIYLGEYTGIYCEGCEAYYFEDDLKNGKCPLHLNLEVKKITEKNYFFKWSKYSNFLIDHIKKNQDSIFPKARRNEMLEFAKNIKDVPVSRTNFTWGIKVPNDPGQVIYVWFDALINYLTGVGFLEDETLFEKFWPADVHVLGKDNLRWHSLLWPAMLKSAGIELPKTILVNGFLKLNGEKISKSLGNIIRPSEWVKKYGTDGVRYYLLRYCTVTEDSDVSEEKLKQAYNSDLANGLGNLVARVAKLCEKNGVEGENFEVKFDENVEKAIREYRLNDGLKEIWRKITDVDKKINEEKPWELNRDEAKNKLKNYVIEIQNIAFNLKPFLPETAEKIEKQFSENQIKSQPPLFPRI
ncbi:MAG: methionine--tRNA ligase [Patescibacteria group bacterium]|nr:methionine--tRNA ligase [Patescibacteria group bacterium]